MLATEEKPPNNGLNGRDYKPPRHEPEPPDAGRIALAINVIDQATLRARKVRALHKAVARLEREQEEKRLLIDEVERECLEAIAWLLDEIAADREQIERFEVLVHELEGEGRCHG